MEEDSLWRRARRTREAAAIRVMRRESISRVYRLPAQRRPDPPTLLLCMRPQLSRSVVHQTRRHLYAPTRKGYKVDSIFEDARTAEFAAATSNAEGSKLPHLNNLPEVIVTGAYA